MTLQVQEVDLCKLNVQYVAPNEKVKEARSKAIDRIRREKVPVKGYRPGTAPNHVIEFAMKSTIDSLAAKDLVSDAYNDLIFQHKIKTLFYPKVDHQSFDNGKFHCEMTVWKKPEVDLKEYKGFNIPKPATENVKDLTAKMLQDLRMKNGESRPYNEGDFVQLGDKITLDIKAECEGEVINELTQEGMLYQVGQFKELDENLSGMVPDETKSFKVQMAEDAPVDSIKNKIIDFTVTLHMGMRTEPAALDDELAKKLGMSNLSQLETYVNSMFDAQLKDKEKKLLNNQLFIRLIENNPFDVPSWLVELEAENSAKTRGVELSSLPAEIRQKVLVESEKAVKLSLILDSIRENEPETSFSERELLNLLRMKVSESGSNPDEFIKQASKDGSIFGIIANMKDTATVDWILKHCNIVD
jgi:trigger factor